MERLDFLVIIIYGNEIIFLGEFVYLNDYWVKMKAGSLNGYRSQVAMVPPLKTGIFW
jgi:hypothetical protein